MRDRRTGGPRLALTVADALRLAGLARAEGRLQDAARLETIAREIAEEDAEDARSGGRTERDG